jgi:polysaccharide chain length determinant protein (PEP-CTERM system associated)
MSATERDSLSIFSLLDALRRRKLAVLIPTILLTAGFIVFAGLQPDRYRAVALIAAAQTTPPEYLKQVAPPPLHLEDHLWTVREVLFSDAVLQAAAKELKRYRAIERVLSPPELDELKQQITIKVDGEHTFELIYDSGDPHDAMNVTNKLAELFIQKASAKREQKTSETAIVIDEQLEALKDRMEAQSKRIHDFKTGAVTALPDHIDDNIRAVDSTKHELRDKETKIAEEDAKKASIQRELQDLESKGVLEQPLIQEKTPDELKLNELRIQLGAVETRYTPQHPIVIAMKRQISDLEKTIQSQPKKARTEPSQTYLRYSQLKSELEAIDRRIEAYRRDQQELRAQMDTYLGRLQLTPQHEKVIEDMNRELKVGELQFHALLDKQLDTKLQKGFEQQETGVAFTIVEPAGLPHAPYSPQRERLMLMGLAAGLGLGLALAFILEQNDTTFGNVDDFQSFTTLPVVGVVPNIGHEKKRRKLKSVTVTVDNPDSVAAEQYRVLAMKVQQQCEAAQAKTVIITSAAGGEGKSITAINLATALTATTDGRVLLIDADMRKPRISEYLKVSVPVDKGFNDLLVHGGDGSVERYITRFEGLYVIPGSVSHTNPVAALSSPKARVLFEQLKRQFAYIVVDAPPVLPIADSHILAGLSDKVLFVVRARRTPRELFQHAVEGFEPAIVLGAVLNDVDYQRSRYAYAYEYYKKAA